MKIDRRAFVCRFEAEERVMLRIDDLSLNTHVVRNAMDFGGDNEALVFPF